ncbi:MAG: septation protein SpoVG family protein [Planctomycetia bacterium]|nr:septation protein SpoVG family protein [Planctomycetia bacterium]
MEITEVRIKLMEDAGERLQAFCSITFDHCFVIRDLKIIGGTNGSFVAMPSRRLTAHCHQCGCKNHLKAGYCNQCGARLRQDTARDDEGRTKLYADIAHPINQACRDLIQQKVIDAFHLEQERSKQPGYVSSYDDFDDDVAPAPRRTNGTRRDEHRHPEQKHPDQRHADQRHSEPRREPHIRKVPPQDPPAAAQALTGQATPGQMQKIEAPEPEPRGPHTNLNIPASTEAPAEQKPRNFGEGLL